MIDNRVAVEFLWHIIIVGLGAVNIFTNETALDKIEGWMFIMVIILIRILGKQ